MKKILILGGYGNFGGRITAALAKAKLPTIIAGRNQRKAENLLNSLSQQYPESSIEIATFDVNKELSTRLEKLKPKLVINTVGPFQNSDYSIAKNCIQQKIHYIDLADGRDFVNGIGSLNSEATANNVLVISGASTVPGLSSAVISHFKKEFTSIDSLIYGITPGQKTPRGLATTQSILSYLGKPLRPYAGCDQQLYGWQDLYRQTYPELGKRWMANCDIPDLDIFPQRYGIKSLRFSAGMENSALHLSMWLISYLVRLGLPLHLEKHAERLLQLSQLFDIFGTEDGGMHMLLKGTDHEGKPKEIKWFLIVKNSDGPQVPCVPAIILAKKLMANKINSWGAVPCIEMMSLEEYMDELNDFAIQQMVFK